MSNPQLSHRSRWLALLILCLGDLMIVLDTTIVNVALPSIKTDLQFTETSLVWVVNAYMLTFSGFLLLGGRLGDLYGHRRLFLLGISGFTLASLGCGLANSQTLLIIARAVQGLAGAVVSAVAFSLIMNLFTEDAERAKALGVFGFVMASGGSIGVLLGGLLTGLLSWHWIFLVNIPVGILVIALCLYFLPKGSPAVEQGALDWGGAITVTLALMLAVYAVVNGNQMGWLSLPILALLSSAVVFLILFFAIETRVQAPLIPLAIFRQRTIAVANIIGVLWSAGMFAWFFIAALYLQLVLNYSPMQVGLAFLPSNLIMAAFSLGLSALLIGRLGFRLPLSIGMALIAAGLAFFVFAPAEGNGLAFVLPGMTLLGLGAGMALNPLLMVAMNDVDPSESGLASGLMNTAFMMGGSLGLAILASAADLRTHALLRAQVDAISALNGGYHLAFFLGALFALTAAVIAAVFLPEKSRADQEAVPAA